MPTGKRAGSSPLSAPVLRRQEHIVRGIVYIVAATVILMVLAIYRTQTSWPGLLIVLAGVPVYFLWKKSRPTVT